MVWYIIPARKGSVGFPFKNRKLFNYTANIIPKKFSNNTIVTSDDEYILKEAKKYCFSLLNRDENLSSNEASVKDVIIDVIRKKKLQKDDDLVVLSLTYPERTWEDIIKILDFYYKNNAKSLCCGLKPKHHPYLCIEMINSTHGIPVVKHNLYRRQDYPKCLKASMFVGIYKASEICKLNDMLICNDTVYYEIDNDLDVDTEEDFIKFSQNIK